MASKAEQADGMSVRQLKRMKTEKRERFDALDWTGVEEKILVEFFPIQERRYGRLHPPPSFMTTATLLNDWRKKGKHDQQYLIDTYKEEQEKQARKAQSRSRRSSRDKRSVPSTPPAVPSRVSTAKKRRGSTPSPPVSGVCFEGGGGDVEDCEMERLIPRGRALSPPPLQRPIEPCGMEEDQYYNQEVRSIVCRGISTMTIDDSNIQDKDVVKKGHNHLVGNVFRWVGTFLSNNGGVWTYGPDTAGFLVNLNAKASEDYSWRCNRIADEPTKIEYAFSHRTCTEVVATGKHLCLKCLKQQYRLYDMCRSEVQQRKATTDDPMLHGRHDYKKFKSPAIMLPYISELTNQIHVLRTRVWKKDYALKALIAQEVPTTNVNYDLLFDPGTLREGYSKLSSQVDVSEREIFDILFTECLAVRERMKRQGHAKGHSYSPLLIRFAIMLRNKVSQSNYEFFRQVFGLPTNSTLCEYRNADTTAEDGIMHETCIQQSIAMHQLGVPREDFRWYMALSFDSHTIKQMLVWDHNTKRIVGYATDAFDQDIILQEFQRMGEESLDPVEEVAEEDAAEVEPAANKEDGKEKGLALGKHYYVFIVQNVTSKGTPVRFIAARYCVANMSHRWLRSKLEYIEAALAFYGFIVCAESFDGATENRSYIKNRLTMTFQELSAQYLRKTPLDDELEQNWDSLQSAADTALLPAAETGIAEDADEIDSILASSSSSSDDEEFAAEVDTAVVSKKLYTDDELPWDFPIAFKHPTVKDVIIVPVADPGHVVKKERNSMDLSGKEGKTRDLHLNGLPINLRMAHDVWLLTPDADPTHRSEIMLYPKLSKSVFFPTSKSAMRTSDAARAQGNSMMNMLMDFGHKNPRAGPNTYDSMILHSANTDLWFNVMNGSRSKGCELISSAQHRHIYDLCDYVSYLKQWKDSVSDEFHFFPMSTYEDVCWTSLGTVVLAHYYLPRHPEHDIIQAHLSSDPCESTFGMKRNANPNANKRDTDNILATVHGGVIMQLAASRKANVKKQRVFFGKELMVGKIKRTRQKDLE